LVAAIPTNVVTNMAPPSALKPESDRPKTPSHHPIYGIHLEAELIQRIVLTAFPDCHIESADELPPGSSYNNRIYFISITERKGGLPEGNDLQRYPANLVLKVMGRFWGAEKVQNEVGCLSLLESHCPQVPAPRVMAWSEDGARINVVSSDRRTSRRKVMPLQETLLAEDKPRERNWGWILTTKLTGTCLSSMKIDELEMKSVGSQLAEFVAGWRSQLPKESCCGSVRFLESGAKSCAKISNTDDGPGIFGNAMLVKGLVMDGIDLEEPITSITDYYRVKLEDKIRQLNTNDVYAPNRFIAQRVRDLITNILPKLHVAQEPAEFVLTHYDLSPRNILVSGSPIRITGLVDFEFSGFFPPLDEFVNDWVDNGGDWAPTVYEAYLSRLEELHVPTPAKGIAKETWEQAHLMGQIEENIAPWWLPGPFSGEILHDELKKAENKFMKALEQLQSSL
jgi:hypothetical protein